MVVPFSAGGPLDLVARTLSDKLSARLKQPFVIENRVGAGGNLGTEVVAKAPPDGYTLLMVLATTLTANPALYKKLPFDADKDLRPISLLTNSSQMMVVHPSVPVNSLAEFVALAKKEPLTYAHAGPGSGGHLTMEYFRTVAGFETVQVPYRGNAPLVIDLVAGQVKAGFVSTAGVIGHVRAGRLKGLAISSAKRSPLAPDVPTAAEAGYPDFKVDTYFAMLGPAGLPGRSRICSSARHCWHCSFPICRRSSAPRTSRWSERPAPKPRPACAPTPRCGRASPRPPTCGSTDRNPLAGQGVAHLKIETERGQWWQRGRTFSSSSPTSIATIISAATAIRS